MDDELIKFKGVRKKFGKNLVLDSVDIDFPEKKITGIIGASGEGKTTVLKLLVGFYKPTKGKIFYSKRNINEDMKNIRKIFGFATEDGSFYYTLTVYENLFHFGSLYNIKKKILKERIEKLLKLVGLENARNTSAKNLSMGMKKRLDVAISLITNPKVLIMDEPTADLDPLLRRDMMRLIKKINQRGTTIILTTQILGEMENLCDKIAILFEKNITEVGTPNSIKSKYKSSNLNHVFNKIFSKGNDEKNGNSEENKKRDKKDENDKKERDNKKEKEDKEKNKEKQKSEKRNKNKEKGK